MKILLTEEKSRQSAAAVSDEDSRESEGKISTAGGLEGADPRRSGMARRGGLQGAIRGAR